MNHWVKQYWKWPAAGLALIALSVAASLLSPAYWIDALRDWIAAAGSFGVVLFALAYALATVLLIPGSIRTIAAGMLFGVTLGAFAAWSGAVLGAALAFLVGRHFVRLRIENITRDSRKFQLIDEAICRHGWKIIALMRLSPLIPFNLSNYFYGVTNVGFWPYVLASAAGMLPGTLFYAYLGAAGMAGLDEGEMQLPPLKYAFFGVGLLATIGLMIWVARIARRSLQESGATQGNSGG